MNAQLEAWLNIAFLSAFRKWLELMRGEDDSWSFYLYLNGYNDGLDAPLAPWEEWQHFILTTPKQSQTVEQFNQYLKFKSSFLYRR